MKEIQWKNKKLLNKKHNKLNKIIHLLCIKEQVD